MIINGREIIFHLKFLFEFKKVVNYLSAKTDQGTNNFIEGINEMVFEKIAKRPTSFPEFKHKKTQAKVYRKANYNKKWSIVYKIESKRLIIIYLYHSSRDPKKLKI